MKQDIRRKDSLDRANVEGRAAFATGAFGLTAGLVMLLDRVGAPEGLVMTTGPLAMLVGVAIIGLLVRSMRVSQFYAAGRMVPAAYAALAAAAIGCGLALPFAPPIFGETSGATILAGIGGGLVCAMLVSGPLLRKTGAFSISDLIAVRFPNKALRLGLAVIVAACAGMAALAGFETAVSALALSAHLSRTTAAVFVASAVFLAAAPGGMAGVVWAAVGAGGVFLTAFCLPLAHQFWRGAVVAAPFIDGSMLWSSAQRQIAEWQDSAINTDVSWFLLFPGVAVGVASLAPLLAPLIVVRDRAAALRSGFGAIAWSSVFALLIAAALAASTLGLTGAVAGKRADQLPVALYDGSEAGLIKICGALAANAQEALKACQQNKRIAAAGGLLSAKDVQPSGVFLLTAQAPLAHLGAAVASLMQSGVIVIGVMLAASGFFACATAISHDAFYRLRGQKALTSRRLATTRAILFCVVILAAVITANGPVNPRILIALALTLAAAGVSPLLALSLWPRALGQNALVGLLAGLCFAEIILMTGEASIDRMALAALAGFFCAVIAGVATSYASHGDRAQSEAFVNAVFHGEGDVIAPDKGA